MADVEKGKAPPAYSETAGYPTQGYSQEPYPPQGYTNQPYSGYGAYPEGTPGGYAPSGYPDTQQDYLLSSNRGGFDDASIRQGFIRKVYSIIFCQLAVTTIITMIFCFNESVKQWSQTSTAQGFMIANIVILLVTEIVLVCCDGVRRKHPLNLVILFVFTLSLSFMVAVIASSYDVNAVFVAAAATCLIVLSLTLFSLQTKYDFTGAGPYLFVFLMCFIIFGLFAAIFHSEVVHVLYACIGVLLFSFYLVYDTQLIVGGRRFEISEEEHVLGALMIYIDIVQIFLYLLEIFGRR